MTGRDFIFWLCDFFVLGFCLGGIVTVKLVQRGYLR